MRAGSGPSYVTLSCPQLHEALRVAISPPVGWDLDHGLVVTASISLGRQVRVRGSKTAMPNPSTPRRSDPGCPFAPASSSPLRSATVEAPAYPLRYTFRACT